MDRRASQGVSSVSFFFFFFVKVPRTVCARRQRNRSKFSRGFEHEVSTTVAIFFSKPACIILLLIIVTSTDKSEYNYLNTQEVINTRKVVFQQTASRFYCGLCIQLTLQFCYDSTSAVLPSRRHLVSTS